MAEYVVLYQWQDHLGRPHAVDKDQSDEVRLRVKKEMNLVNEPPVRCVCVQLYYYCILVLCVCVVNKYIKIAVSDI